MNTELSINVKSNRGKQSVSARELHEKLGIKSHFYDWFKKMCNYGFEENVDYKRVTQKKVTLGGEQTFVDYALSMDMAKEICMVQRTDIGRKFRLYFIEVEKRYVEQQSTEYKKLRSKSKEVRNDFTATLQDRGLTERYEYINVTNAMKKPFGITAKKKDMKIPELAKISAAEALAVAMFTDEYGYHEVKPVCVNASNAVNNTIECNRKKLPA